MCRRHETAKQLYASMGEQGLSPDHVTYGNIIRSYLQQALGRGRQPQAEVLSEWWYCREMALCDAGVVGEGAAPRYRLTSKQCRA
jgi:hypothetical protein